jgi:hypothetical protein
MKANFSGVLFAILLIAVIPTIVNMPGPSHPDPCLGRSGAD